jgi:hypothetical protein
MRRILVLAALIAGLVAPLSAQATGIPEVGPRIALFAPPATFPAGTPFHVKQGFTCEASRLACLNGLTHFDLFVDGRNLPSATDFVFGEDGALLAKFNLTNVWEGLPAGRHTFLGRFYYLGELVQTQEVTIDFV